MVPDLTFDGPAPAEETRQLRKAHPREGHRDNRFTGIRTPYFDGKVRQFPDRAPAAQELKPHMPSTAEHPTERSLGEEGLERRLVGPLGEHREVPQLHPARGHHGCTQFHPDEDFDVMQPRCRRRTQERADRFAQRRMCEMEGIDAHR